MAKPPTREQASENAAFLRRLRVTGNARLSARETGVAYGTMQHRRGAHPGLAVRWDAAVATAQARLHERGRVAPTRAAPGDPRRTEGGEPVVCHVRGGRLQIRRAHPNKLTRASEQAFLAALSATANITLAATAAGASFAAFDRRRRRNPAFAREMKLALQIGYERVEAALLESWNPASREDEAWRANEPPPTPAMTPAQALQLLYLHQKEARLSDGHAAMRPRPHESRDATSARLAHAYIARLAQEAEDTRLATVLRNAADRARADAETDRPPLPALDQVTGWSRADPDAVAADPARALFGGWRIGDMTEKQREVGRARRGRGRKGE